MKDGIMVGMHQGKVMMRLAKHYGDLVAVIKEIVQNAIDSGAARVEVRINMQQRALTVLDNGTGASNEKVGLALQSIGETLKERDKYGQFGLGLISPISVATQFTFTTCPTPRISGFRQYDFVTRDIIKQANVVIPQSEVGGLVHDPNGKVWWRTKVDVKGITRDQRVSALDPDGLCNDIALTFGEKIREKGINVQVHFVSESGELSSAKVEAPEFSGEAIGAVVLDPQVGREAGKVVLELYIARIARGGRKGNIVFGTQSNPSRITARQFVVCTQHILKPEVAKALISGLFEGRILCQNLLLHADRTRFEDNDALFAFCEILESWWKKGGQKWVQKIEEDTDDERFQMIGSQAMRFGELLLKQAPFAAVFAGIKIGTIGNRHSDVPRKKIIGPDEGTSISGVGAGKSQRAGGAPPKANEPTVERVGHRPGPVYGPGGRVRTEVKGNSTGLRFSHVEMDDFRIPFTYDAETGLLAFNMRHPNWGLCRGSDAFLREYHIAVIIKALSLELFKGQGGSIDPQVLKFAYEDLAHTVFGIVNGKAVAMSDSGKN